MNGRRWGLGLGITALVVWVAVLLAGIVAVFATGPRTATVARRWAEEVVAGEGTAKVALIEVTGEIVPGRGSEGFFGSGFLGAQDYVGQLRQALEDDDVKAVLIRLETPGGAVVASDEIYRTVLEVDARKPVIASMGDIAASGGYYIAAGASEVWASPGSVTGSIGVIAVFPNLEGTAKKLGVKPLVIKSGPHKDLGSPFRRVTPEERGILQSLIDESYDAFVTAVAKGRSLTRAVVLDLADGRVYSGTQAKENGLIDQLGGFEDAFAAARRKAGVEEARLVRYTRSSGGIADALFGFASGSLRTEVREAITGAGADIVGLPSRAGLHYLWLG